MPLTDLQIRNAKPDPSKVVRLTDGQGLQIEIRPSGAKLWRFRYRIDGRENMFAAGSYAQSPAGETAKQAAVRLAGGQLTLAEARAKLVGWRASVKAGKHPVVVRSEDAEERRRADANTFRSVAEEWIEASRSGWTAYYASQVENGFKNHIYPRLGDKPVGAIKPRDLTQALTGMQRLRREVSGQRRTNDFKVLPVLLKGWCSAVFRRAIALGLIDTDPTYSLRGVIKRGAVTNHVPLNGKQIADLLTSLRSYAGHPKTAIAARLLLLTFTRPGELRCAEWSEFDLKAKEWNIPKARMKMGKDHVVPLSKQAIGELRTLRQLTGSGKLLFPNERDRRRPMSATTLNRCLERLKFNGPNTIDFSAHGFRTTASTMLNESGKFRPDAIERQLAHVPANEVRATYNKALYMDERRPMMQAWADMVDAFAAASQVNEGEDEEAEEA